MADVNKERRVCVRCVKRGYEQGNARCTHLEGVGIVGDIVGDDDDDEDDCGCGWQEAEVTLVPREETEVLLPSLFVLHHIHTGYVFFSLF